MFRHVVEEICYFSICFHHPINLYSFDQVLKFDHKLLNICKHCSIAYEVD